MRTPRRTGGWQRAMVCGACRFLATGCSKCMPFVTVLSVPAEGASSVRSHSAKDPVPCVRPWEVALCAAAPTALPGSEGRAGSMRVSSMPVKADAAMTPCRGRSCGAQFAAAGGGLCGGTGRGVAAQGWETPGWPAGAACKSTCMYQLPGYEWLCWGEKFSDISMSSGFECTFAGACWIATAWLHNAVKANPAGRQSGCCVRARPEQAALAGVCFWTGIHHNGCGSECHQSQRWGSMAACILGAAG